jgi:hypothetical protein
MVDKITQTANEQEPPIPPGEGDPAEKAAPLSVRDSIKAALQESRDKEAEEEIEDPKPRKIKSSEDPVEETTEEITEEEIVDPVEETTGEEISTSEEGKTPEDKSTREKVKAPDAWGKEPDWEKVPSSIQKRIAKREQEFQEGINSYNQKAQAFDEYEKSIGPRRQAMARLNVTPSQVVERALDWMDALGHPDPKTKGDAFRLLAGNFGIDLASLGTTETARSGESFRATGDINQSVDIDALRGAVRGEVEGLTTEMRQQMNALINAQRQQSDASAQAYVSNWSNGKTYYDTVKGRMGELLQSGAIPLKDGTLDLDRAYELACYENETVRKSQQLEKARAAKKKQEEQKAKEEKDRKDKIAKARSVNGSLRPGSLSPSLTVRKPNADGLSVRDTIKLSLKQVAGAE